jgi:hypothetical protein
VVRQYYVPQITELSEQELHAVFEAVEPPVCLLGGWAVHLHVTPGFHSEHGREYIGSRDIDIGVHVDASWTGEDFSETPVGDSISAIEDLGYTKSRFGFVQHFLRDSQDRISEAKASEHSIHEVFQVYLDSARESRPSSEKRVFRHLLSEPRSEQGGSESRKLR